MGKYGVHHSTVDGLYEASKLFHQRKSKASNIKDIEDFLSLKSTKDFIETIASSESKSSSEVVKCVSNSEDSENVRVADFESITESKNKGKRGQPLQRYYFHPLLYLEFAMWINPRLKYDVLKYILDNQSIFANYLNSKTP
jgi:hypothetical protein